MNIVAQAGGSAAFDEPDIASRVGLIEDMRVITGGPDRRGENSLRWA